MFHLLRATTAVVILRFAKSSRWMSLVIVVTIASASEAFSLISFTCSIKFYNKSNVRFGSQVVTRNHY